MKSTLMLSALALSLGMALSPVSVFAAETASSSSQQLPSPAPMLEKVMPSVVSISVEGSTTVKTRACRSSSSNSLAIIPVLSGRVAVRVHPCAGRRR